MTTTITTPAQIIEKIAVDIGDIRENIEQIKEKIARLDGVRFLSSTVADLHREIGILEGLKEVDFRFKELADCGHDDTTTFVNFLHMLVNIQRDVVRNDGSESRHLVEGKSIAVREASNMVRDAFLDASRDRANA